MHRAYKVRLYPNKTQELLMQKTLDASRHVYNHYLEKRKNHYLEGNGDLKYVAMARDLTHFRKTDSVLAGVQSEPVQQALRRLDKSYNAFFRGTSRFPKFKSRFAPHQSFQKHQCWQVLGNKIRIQSDLDVKFRGFIDTKATLGTLVVAKESTSKWYATITAEVPHKPTTTFTEPVGIDVGIETLAVTSEGKKYKNIRPQESLQHKLTQAQRTLSRRKRGSKRRAKAKEAVARVYAKIRNKRENHIHHISREIVNGNPTHIAMEDLNVAGMVQNRRLARVIADASMRELTRQIEYKQTWNGGTFEKIGRFFPSSKTCHGCGFIVDSLPLSERKWTCPQCGVEHDRDINAAKVILAQSLAYSERGEKGRVSVRRESPSSLKRGQAKGLIRK